MASARVMRSVRRHNGHRPWQWLVATGFMYDIMTGVASDVNRSYVDILPGMKRIWSFVVVLLVLGVVMVLAGCSGGGGGGGSAGADEAVDGES